MAFLQDLRIEVRFSRWEFVARYNMTASDAESLALADLLALAPPRDREALERLWLGYIPTFGTDELRHGIAATYDSIDADGVLCCAGGEEGIYVALHALLAPGDHAIVVTPGYQSTETICRSLCATASVALDHARSWQLDLDRVRDAIRPTTKLLAINFPNNPTGKVLERELFDELVALCRKHGLWLFSDEVYRSMEREGVIPLPQAVDAYERGLSLNVLSKVYGLPGLRIGWIASRDRALLRRMERVRHYLSTCNATVSEALAVIALRARGQILERNRQLVRANLELVHGFFKDYPNLFDWTIPDGGLVGYPRYTGVDGVEAFTERLVGEAGVLLMPASIFSDDTDASGGDRFRIGYGRSYVGAGLEAMRAWIGQHV